MSIVSGTLGAVLSAQGQEEANQANQEMARELNRLNYQMFQEGRGSTGSAFLPLYMGGTEKQLGQDALSFYNSSRNLLGTPEQQFARYNAAVDPYKFSMDAGRGALADIYNGNLTGARLGYAAPVAAARTGVAQAQKQGILQGLQERINALNSGNAAKGYSGTGSFAQNRLLGSTVGARQAAAGAGALANLQNAEDTRGIYDQGANLRLQYMNMPYQQAQNALAMEMAPAAQVQQNFSRSLAPFEFFRLGQGTFQNQPLPQVQANNTLPAIMAGIGSANQQVGQYFANQQAQKNYTNAMQNAQLYGAVGNMSTGYGTSGWGAGWGGAGAGAGSVGAMGYDYGAALA